MLPLYTLPPLQEHAAEGKECKEALAIQARGTGNLEGGSMSNLEGVSQTNASLQAGGRQHI